MGYQHIVVPDKGEKITVNGDGNLHIPDQPIIPFIEGDGIGVDITPVMIKVVDEAVQKSYDGQRRISWMEVYAARSRWNCTARTSGCRTRRSMPCASSSWASRVP